MADSEDDAAAAGDPDGTSDFGDEPAENLQSEIHYRLDGNWTTSNFLRVEPSATPVDEYEDARNKQAKEVADQAGQNTRWRPILFWTVYAIVLSVAVVSVGGIIAYMVIFGKDASPVVLSTWAGGSVAQIVGLMLVITRHLFPQDHDPMIPHEKHRD